MEKKTKKVEFILLWHLNAKWQDCKLVNVLQKTKVNEEKAHGLEFYIYFSSAYSSQENVNTHPKK